MRIRIRVRFLIKVMGICDHWSIGPILSLQVSVVSIHATVVVLLNFEFNVDPDRHLKIIRIRICNPGFTDVSPLYRKYLPFSGLSSFILAHPSALPASIWHHKLQKVNIHLVSLYFGGSCLSLESLSIFS
jgi:hypothetical protein